MKAEIYSKIGVLYIKIHEENNINEEDIDRILKEWGYSDLIEIFDDNDRLVFVYTNC